MEFKDYVKRINSVKEIKTFGQISPEKQKQNRLSIKSNKMILQEIEKSKFAQINDKRHYFSDGIVSLPISHPYLHEIVKFKRDKKKKIEAFLHKLILMEKFAVENNNRISIYRDILQQKPTFFHHGSQKRNVVNNQSITFSQTRRSYILNGFWQ